MKTERSYLPSGEKRLIIRDPYLDVLVGLKCCSQYLVIDLGDNTIEVTMKEGMKHGREK